MTALPDVKALTSEQQKRVGAMSTEMSASYWGLYSACSVIVSLQDTLAETTLKLLKAEADMAWIRRRTQFWGEVPAETTGEAPK